jgi:hypothetical protein
MAAETGGYDFDGDMLPIDLLVGLMAGLSVAHAREAGEGYGLVFLGLLLGVVTEWAALRFGGTHCHASSQHFPDVAPCSSANSVLYYLPWTYCCVTSARRLVGRDSSLALPFVTATLFFGFCGVYEMQGPLMRWWLWPDAATNVVKANCTLQQYGALAADAGSMVVSPHAAEALLERQWACPVLAPFFDMVFGWGVAAACQLLSFPTSLPAQGAVALLAPALAMLWDPVRCLLLASLRRRPAPPLFSRAAAACDYEDHTYQHLI